MNPFWVAPVVVLAIGLAVVLFVAVDAARAARQLGEEVRRFAEVRGPLRDLNEASGELRRGLDRDRHKGRHQ